MKRNERLDRLTERHEALAQTVEHMAHQGEEQNLRIAAQSANIEKLLTVVENLTFIVHSHENRREKGDL